MIQVGWIIERFIFEIANTIFVDYLCIDIPKLITHAFKALWWLYEDIQFFFVELMKNEGMKEKNGIFTKCISEGLYII